MEMFLEFQVENIFSKPTRITYGLHLTLIYIYLIYII
jgi:hypothetical protein